MIPLVHIADFVQTSQAEAFGLLVPMNLGFVASVGS